MELLKESSKHGIITIQNRVGHVRDLKNHGFSNNLSSEIHKKASAYQCGSKRCDIFLSEKVSIICSDLDTLFNKRTALICKCHHRSKFLLVKAKK